MLRLRLWVTPLAALFLASCSLIYDFDRPLAPGLGTGGPVDGADGGLFDGLIPVLPADAGGRPIPQGGSTSQCAPLGQRRGNVIEITPEQVDSLPGLMEGAAPNTTIKLMPGDYVLDQGLLLNAEGLILRSATGNRDTVVIDGSAHAQVGSVLTISGSNITVADLTIINAHTHGILVRPPEMDGQGRTGPLIYNVRVADSRSSAIVVDSQGGSYMDNGTIGCSLIELGAQARGETVDGCLMGGIVIYRSLDWRIHDNLVRGIFCENEAALHGIHVTAQSARTIVEGNQVLDCARGIGIGYYGDGESMRPYEGADCADSDYIDDHDSLVRNNFVAANDPRLLTSTAGFQHGIGVWNACNTSVYHNTVFSPRAPTDAPIDIRYGSTTARLKNNLLSHAVRIRDEAVVTTEGNLENVPDTLFVSAATGDLHLKPDSEAKDRGIELGVEAPAVDIDGDARSDGLPDPGADEL